MTRISRDGLFRSALWIAPAGDKPRNYYFLARSSFRIGAPPARAFLRITADARYAAYINGQFAGNGPVRGTHRRYFADCLDVTALLQSGVNWIAVEVHCCLKPTYTMAPLLPALLAEIEGLTATDAASWQVRVDPSHRPDALVYTGQIGFSEWKDLTEENPGWMTGQDNPQSWQPPLEYGEPDSLGGRRTAPRPIAPPTNEPCRPVRLVEAGLVPASPETAGNPDYAALLSAEPHTPDAGSPSGAAAFPIRIAPGPGRDGRYLIFDFGREVFGNLSVDIEAPAGTILDASHADGLFGGRLHALLGNYRFADRFVLRAGRQSVNQRLHARGFRFLQLTLRDFSAPVRVHGVTLASRSYSQPIAAAFACSDPFLNRLWAMCVDTVQACSADTFMDCPWREQALWTNDASVTSLYYLALTGDPAYAAHNLRMGADGARPDGLIPPVYPSQVQRPFPLLPALWTFALSDYYRYTGDAAALRELLPVMERALGIYDLWRDTDGLVPDQEGMWNFIDWGYRGGQPRTASGGKTAVLNLLIAAACKRAALLEQALGRPGRATDYDTRSRRTVAAVNASLWEPAHGCFRDCTAYADGAAPTSSQHPLAIGLYHNLFDKPQREAALESLTRPGLVQAEFYFQHYVIQALARHGRAAEALAVVRALWCRNVEAECNTVWEFHTAHEDVPEAMPYHSRCHAFSCAPLYFLQSVVLGVRPTQPGFAEFTLAPQPGDLAEAQGAVPTPHGLIRVAWRRAAPGTLSVSIDIPAGTRAVTTPTGEVRGPGRHELEMHF